MSSGGYKSRKYLEGTFFKPNKTTCEMDQYYPQFTDEKMEP